MDHAGNWAVCLQAAYSRLHDRLPVGCAKAPTRLSHQRMRLMAPCGAPKKCCAFFGTLLAVLLSRAQGSVLAAHLIRVRTGATKRICTVLLQLAPFAHPTNEPNCYAAGNYLFTLAQWIEADGVGPKRIPRVLDHRRRMLERPAVNKAIAQELAE